MEMILHGKEVAEKIYDDFKPVLKKLCASNIFPGLCIIEHWERECVVDLAQRIKKYGINCEVHKLAAGISENQILDLINEYNEDSNVHGVYFCENDADYLSGTVRDGISPEKDVNCIGSVNISRLFLENEGFVPCIAEAVIELLDYYEIKIKNKNVVIIGNENLLLKHLTLLLMRRNAIVTVCNDDVKEPAEITKEADIVVTASKRSKIFGREFFTGHSVVIDTGFLRNVDGQLCGNVNYSSVCEKVKCITPVPGGIDMIATALLAKHVVRAAEKITIGR